MLGSAESAPQGAWVPFVRQMIDRMATGVAVWLNGTQPAIWNAALGTLLGLDPAQLAVLTPDALRTRFIAADGEMRPGRQLLLQHDPRRVSEVDVSWSRLPLPEPEVGTALVVSVTPVDASSRDAWTELVIVDGAVTLCVSRDPELDGDRSVEGRTEAEAVARIQSQTELGRMPRFSVVRREIRPGVGLVRLTPTEPSERLGAEHLIAATAHEFRNPLATIRGYLQLLPGASPAKHDAYLARLVREVDRLDGILADMLEPRMLMDAGPSSTDPAQAVSEAVAYLGPWAASRGVTLSGTADSGRSVMASIGHSRLFQVLLNLVQNAVEAVPADVGRVAVSLDGSDGMIRICVDDNGAGFAGADALMRSRKPGGHGLGIAICRWLLAMHGGTLTYSRSPLGGTRAEVLLRPCEADGVPGRMGAASGLT